MSQIADLLIPTHVHCQLEGSSRKRVLQHVAQLLASPELSEDALFDGLMARERLGSTGLGEGVAIPHCRLPCQKMQVALVSLNKAIDYEAVDGDPVDLLFFLIVPDHETQAHLDALAQLSKVFADSEYRNQLRRCESDQELLHTMHQLLAA